MEPNKNKEVKSREKIDKLNEIIEELLGDATELTKDLTASIRMHFFYGCLAILFGLQFGWYNFYHFKDYHPIPILIFGGMILAGMYFILRYFVLKKKFVRLFAIQKELSHS